MKHWSENIQSWWFILMGLVLLWGISVSIGIVIWIQTINLTLRIITYVTAFNAYHFLKSCCWQYVMFWNYLRCCGHRSMIANAFFSQVIASAYVRPGRPVTLHVHTSELHTITLSKNSLQYKQTAMTRKNYQSVKVGIVLESMQSGMFNSIIFSSSSRCYL